MVCCILYNIKDKQKLCIQDTGNSGWKIWPRQFVSTLHDMTVATEMMLALFEKYCA